MILFIRLLEVLEPVARLTVQPAPGETFLTDTVLSFFVYRGALHQHSVRLVRPVSVNQLLIQLRPPEK